MSLRTYLRRSRSARRIYRKVAPWRNQVVKSVMYPIVSFQTVPKPVAIRLVYQVMLRRDPDPVGYSDYLGRLDSGSLTRSGMADEVRGSEEYQTHVRFPGEKLGFSIHAGRQQFIRSLPRADRIVDLGGTHQAKEEGALVALGYPYDFEELIIVDLPSDDRHEIYQTSSHPTEVHTARGLVTYRYHSMTELGDLADSSIELVYSGQSIEHVPPDAGAHVVKEVFRILTPGGFLAIDTPNGRVTRTQQSAFIDPDHEVEYTYPELRHLLEESGFEIVFAKGLNYAGPAIASGEFDLETTSGNSGLFDAIEDSYILCVVAQKPKSRRSRRQPG